MSHEQFKAYLQRDKLFLKELYTSDSKSKIKNTLIFSSEGELNTLIKYIHLLSNGEIHMKKQNFDALATHLKFLKKNFEKKSSFQRLSHSHRKDKIKLLLRFQTLFPHLLAPLFVE